MSTRKRRRRRSDDEDLGEALAAPLGGLAGGSAGSGRAADQVKRVKKIHGVVVSRRFKVRPVCICLSIGLLPFGN